MDYLQEVPGEQGVTFPPAGAISSPGQLAFHVRGPDVTPAGSCVVPKT